MKPLIGHPMQYRRMAVHMEILDNEGPPVVLDRPEAVASFVQAMLRSPQEVFVWLAVDASKRLIALDELFRGTVDACTVHPREVFRNALLVAPTVTGIFLVHNHPSGSIEPSEEDRLVFDRVRRAGDLLAIPVIDCLIVGEEGFYSEEAGLVRRPARYVRTLATTDGVEETEREVGDG